LANGTTATAISGDYAGAAGSNHGFVSYDELWGYVSEASTGLWEELTPVPTRKNSIRFKGQGERLHPELPLFANREARLFAYWDHEPRRYMGSVGEIIKQMANCDGYSGAVTISAPRGQAATGVRVDPGDYDVRQG
jgi:hypothetical protein